MVLLGYPIALAIGQCTMAARNKEGVRAVVSRHAGVVLAVVENAPAWRLDLEIVDRGSGAHGRYPGEAIDFGPVALPRR